MRVQNGVCLLRVQSVRAGLDRLCSGRNLNFKWAQRACTIIQFGRGEKISAYSAGVALRASIALGSQPGAFSVPGAEEKIRIRPVQRLGGGGCNIFVPVLGEDGTKIAPTGDIFD